METKTYYFIQLITGMIIVSDRKISFDKGWLQTEYDGLKLMQHFWNEETKHLMRSLYIERQRVVALWKQEAYTSYWEAIYEQPIAE